VRTAWRSTAFDLRPWDQLDDARLTGHLARAPAGPVAGHGPTGPHVAAPNRFRHEPAKPLPLAVGQHVIQCRAHRRDLRLVALLRGGPGAVRVDLGGGDVRRAGDPRA